MSENVDGSGPRDRSPAAAGNRNKRLTPAQMRLVDWMRDGDRALQRRPWDSNADAYGHYSNKKFIRLCSRKTVDALVRAGVVEWMSDYPPDLRVMLILADSAPGGSKASDVSEPVNT